MRGPLVVVGDSLLDVDTVGTARRLSPDGPVPVLDGATDRRRPGGAALVACLAAGAADPGDAGAPARTVRLVTPLADDADAATLRSLLPTGVELVALPWAGSTPVKQRIRAGGQTVVRVDRGGDTGAVGVPTDGPTVADALRDAAAVVVADYGYGATADAEVRRALTAAARHVPVVWDPHPRGADPVGGVTLVVPNEREALPELDGAGVPDLARRARELRARWRVGDVAVTAGRRGAVMTVGPDSVMVVPAEPVDAGDTCGAGDRFAAATAWALADGRVPSEAVVAGVAAASAFVAAGGLGPDDAPGAGTPSAGTPAGRRGVLVASGGCFDLLHAGHVATLEAARRLGDELVVCVNSDASVRRLKGPDRPLQPAADRVRILEALACVDRAVVFDEDTPAQVLRRLRPDLWVKGGDYAGAELPEQAVLDEWGGRAVTVPFLTGRSTTALVGRATGRDAASLPW